MIWQKLFQRGGRLFEENTETGGGNGAGTGTETNKGGDLDAKGVQGLIDRALSAHAEKLDGKFSELSSTLSALLGTKKDETPGTNEDPATSNNDISPSAKARLDAAEKRQKATQERLDKLEQQKQEADARAEKVDRESQIRNAVSAVKWATPADAETMNDILLSKVTREKDGSLVVGDTTVEGFIQSYTDKRQKMLAPSDVNGSGSGPGGVAGRGNVDLNADLSTPEARKAYFAQIQKVARQGR